MKRKSISKKMREAVYNKYDGHCAYCGKELEPKGWQLDHLIPYQRERFGRYTEEQIECFENYMPACRRCNNYKRAHSLEVFRRYIKEIPEKLKKTTFIYKVGLDYGIIEEHNWNGQFYFEWYENNC
jgi:5-methylcytosine-specific restriction endonuclease McrA